MEGTQKTVENFEKMLLFLAVIGGSAGALAGMYIFHHKTLHKSLRLECRLFW